jgi:Arc/MetJ family transcription regulator
MAARGVVEMILRTSIKEDGEARLLQEDGFAGDEEFWLAARRSYCAPGRH